MTYEQAAKKLRSESIEWVMEHIHPYVEREHSDTDRDYFRKMTLWLMITDTAESPTLPNYPQEIRDYQMDIKEVDKIRHS